MMNNTMPLSTHKLFALSLVFTSLSVFGILTRCPRPLYIHLECLCVCTQVHVCVSVCGGDECGQVLCRGCSGSV